jgi:hypothetical protein
MMSTTSGAPGLDNGKWLRAVTSGPLDALGRGSQVPEGPGRSGSLSEEGRARRQVRRGQVTVSGSGRWQAAVGRAGTRFAGPRRSRPARKGMRKIRGEGEGHTPSDRPLPVVSRRAGTAVPSEQEVVLGHAYAIPALSAISDGRCGNDKPTSSSVDGVTTQNPGPRCYGTGALMTWRCNGPSPAAHGRQTRR